MKTFTDVFVIGGGPAGLAAAIAARQRGFSVIVADGRKPPIDKPCGEGLMPESVAALADLGVEGILSSGLAFSGIRFIDDHVSVSAKFPTCSGIGIRRTDLHEKIVKRAVQVGVKFLWETPVTGIHGHTANLVGEDVIEARWIVGADGARSRVRRWTGLDSPGRQRMRFASRGHYRVAPWSDCVEIYWGQHGQAYVTPVSQSEVCVVVIARKPNWHLREALTEFPKLAEHLAHSNMSRSEKGAVSMMHRLHRVYSGHVALIGDASGGVDAITGEGLSLSLRQATALADSMANNNLAAYQRLHRRMALRPAFMARLILLLDGRPRLRTRAMKALSANPNLFARMTAIHVGETSSIHVVTTGALLGWKFLEA